ncbi:hypothetical protein NDU88_001975 [Pleurodeles waltl]|uniref:Uncharacterized protein n=1 Tax=Pleurodeles waltl TaxID=8319 RepID=A0AAV7VYC0_PLEWA|nr:hypothetical protein NDU88_001975 [Pleurodeles waltl]
MRHVHVTPRRWQRSGGSASVSGRRSCADLIAPLELLRKGDECFNHLSNENVMKQKSSQPGRGPSHSLVYDAVCMNLCLQPRCVCA